MNFSNKELKQLVAGLDGYIVERGQQPSIYAGKYDKTLILKKAKEGLIIAIYDIKTNEMSVSLMCFKTYKKDFQAADCFEKRVNQLVKKHKAAEKHQKRFNKASAELNKALLNFIKIAGNNTD